MAKVTLSTAEMNLVTQQDFILTKNSIIKKVYELFGNINTFYQVEIEKINTVPKEVLAVSAKISRGENYRELPWVILDYPRYFKDENIFAVRTFFWWGNSISVHFILQGDGVITMKNIIKENKNNLQDWFLCCHQTLWQHHFEEDNYLPIQLFSTQQIDELKFIKLAKKIPLQKWDGVEIFLENSFKTLLELLKQISYPSDATIL